MAGQTWFRKLAASWLGFACALRRPSVRSAGLRVEALEDRFAPSIDLVKDINLQPNPVGSQPSQLVNVNGTLFFVASDVHHGAELWKSDGTSAGTVLVRDIRPGYYDSNLSYLTNVNGTLFFRADDGVNGSQLWKSDGTSSGTVLVRSIGGDPSGSFPASLTNVNGTLFFTAQDAINGSELWKSDGTAAGTMLVRDIRTGNQGSYPTSLTNVGGTLFFTAHDGSTGAELWKSDGTSAGTVLVRDIRSAGSYPSFLTNVNGTLFFSALDDTNRSELWKSDGTSAGTVLVRSIGAGITGGNPRYLTSVGASLFFTATDSDNGTELWKSDGTSAGTVLVKDLRPGSGGSNPNNLTNVNGILYFRALDATNGYELWRSDGSSAGTTLVHDVRIGPASSNPSNLTNVNGTLFFTAQDDTRGVELWRSNGTSDDTVLVRDIRPGIHSSTPRSLVNVNGVLYFRAFDDANGEELWASDGTSSGTVLVRDVRPGTHGSYPDNLTNVNGILFFTAFDAAHGTELWKSDGTSAGTVLVKDIFPGVGGSYARYLTNVNGTLFFTAFDAAHGTELWKSDGTAAGTVLVRDIFPGTYGANLHSLTNVNGILFFSASDGEFGTELWKSDGTSAGTVLVRDIRSGNSYPTQLTNVNGTLFFQANDGIHGAELWKSDGTSAGTVLVKDLRPGSTSAYPTQLTNVNGTLFFTAFDSAAGAELWRSDGTSAGTVLVRDIRPGINGSNPSQLTNVNGTLFFSATDDVNRAELWKSDGTSAGTVLVKDIRPGGSGSYPSNLTNVNGTLFFTAVDGVRGAEIWRSDGTSAGTVLVRDVAPGFRSSYPGYLTNVNGTLFFRADPGLNGPGLWKSDGTSAGTVLVADRIPTGPQELLAIGSTLFFSGLEETHGRELWQYVGSGTHTLALDTTGNLTLESIGGGNAGGTLTVSRSGNDLVLFDPAATFNGSLGTVSNEGHRLTIPLSSVTGSLLVNSSRPENTLTIDFSGGNPLPQEGLTYSGGHLVLSQGGFNGLFDAVLHTASGSGGVIYLTSSGGSASTLRYTGPASVVDDLEADHRVYRFTDTAETITLSDAGAADGDRLRLTSSLAGSIAFYQPAVSLTIDTTTGAAAGDDIVTLASVAPTYRASLTVNADSGDTIHVNANLTLGSSRTVGNFTVAGGRGVNLNADIRTNAGPGAAGNISISGPTDLGADVVLDTDSRFGADGNVLFLGPVNADSTANRRTLQVNAGMGNTWFGHVGVARPVQALLVTAGQTTLLGSIRTSDGPVTFASSVVLGTATVLIDVGVGGLSILGTALALGGNTLVVQNTAPASALIASQISGVGATLMKNGTGALLLTGSNSYSGNTIVNAGTLRVSNAIGSGTGSSAITLNNSAVLAGVGTVGGSVRFNDSSRLAPGTPVGTLTLAGGVVWNNGTFLDIDLDGGNDLVRVVGSVALNNATLRLSGSLVPNAAVLQQFVLIDNDGVDPVVGTFQGLPEGSEIALGDGKFYISYAGGSNRNDVVLYSQPVFNGTAGADTLIVRGDGTTFEVSLNGAPAVRLTPAPEATLHFFGGDGDDLLVVQYDASFTVPFTAPSTDPIPGGGIVYDGQGHDFTSRTPLGSGDVIRIQDLRPVRTLQATYTPSPSEPGAGTILLGGSTGGAIRFTGLEPVDISGMAVAVLATSPASSDDHLILSNGLDSATGLTPALVVSGTTGVSAIPIESAHFFNNDLVVLDTTASDGNDVVRILSANNAHGNARLRITTGSGADTVTIDGPVAFTGDGNAATADVEIDSQNIVLNAPLTLTGPNGVVELHARNGSITATWPGVDLQAAHLIASARNGIDLDTTLETVAAQITGVGNIRINETDGLRELNLNAGAGIITVTTGGAIRSSGDAIHVVGGEVRFNVISGSFGTATHPIRTQVVGLTVDTSPGNGDQFVHQYGDFTRLHLNAGTGDVALRVEGSVNDPDADTDIRGGRLHLIAQTGVGSAVEPIHTQVSSLDVSNTTSGGIFLINRGPLTILDSSLDADRLGLIAVGGGCIESIGPLTIASSVLLNAGTTLVSGGVLTVEANATLLLNKGSAMSLILEANGAIALLGEVVTGGLPGPYSVQLVGSGGAQSFTPPQSAGLASQHAAEVQPGGAASILTLDELAPVVEEALRRLAAAGLSAEQLALASAAPFTIADLNSLGLLGQTELSVPQIVLDDDGAGLGWFVDPSPDDDAEFDRTVAATELRAVAGPAVGRYDLLTVVMHELMAVLGYPILSDALAMHDLMATTLASGTRRLPEAIPAMIDEAFRAEPMLLSPPLPPSTPLPLPPAPPPTAPQVRRAKKKKRRPVRPKRRVVPPRLLKRNRS